MRVLGIDFGTSNTVAMLRMPDGRVRPLLFDGSPMLPSAVYLAPDGRMLVGRDAERNARVDPTRFEPNPKRRIDDSTVFLGDKELPVPRLMAHVLEQVLTEARRQIGGNPAEVRMTHPARWGERRRSILVEAARLAGLPRPQLIAEPVGAASYFTSVLGTAVPVGRSLAIYDLGGGTFDATVVRRTQTGFEVLAEEGLSDVGGLDFDHAIVEHLGKTYSESHHQMWTKLVKPQEAGDRRYRRMLYEDVRGCKEMLSRTSNADIHLPALEVDAHLTRDEFESLVKPHLEQTVECLKRTIAGARLQSKDMVGIFLVGGSSRIPLAGHLIHTELGVAPTTLEQPETVVVEGSLAVGSPGGGQRRPVSGMPRPMQQQPRRPGPPARPGGPGPARPVAVPQ
ncbi:MAG: Hsp70 family protein, partial [Micromonosporaceae bacterium]